jgi:hypothetical protein
MNTVFLREEEHIPEFHLLVQYWGTLYEIRIGSNCTREDFLPVSSVFSCYYHSTITPYSSVTAT